MTPAVDDAAGVFACPCSTTDMSVAHLTQQELAGRWRRTPRTLQRWRKAGKGPPWLILEGRVLYRADDVLAYERDRLRGEVAQ